MSDPAPEHPVYHRHRNPVIRHAKARPRLLLSALVSAVLLAVLPHVEDWRLTTELLVAWNAGAILYLVLCFTMMTASSVEHMKWRAQAQDEGRVVILILTVLASAASLIAIIAELAAVRTYPEDPRAFHIGLAVLTILSAWAFTHTMFALHYAHDYYLAKHRGAAGCLEFPGSEAPDYLDFLYFSFVIGTSGQTADVAVATPVMRRVVLVHCVVAFLFNTTVLALTINIAAGLI